MLLLGVSGYAVSRYGTLNETASADGEPPHKAKRTELVITPADLRHAVAFSGSQLDYEKGFRAYHVPTLGVRTAGSNRLWGELRAVNGTPGSLSLP